MAEQSRTQTTGRFRNSHYQILDLLGIKKDPNMIMRAKKAIIKLLKKLPQPKLETATSKTASASKKSDSPRIPRM